MRLPLAAAAVLWVLAAFVLGYYLTGCLWQGEVKPVVGVYIPSLKPIPAAELQCLEQHTYDTMIHNELEWRQAYGACRAVLDELTVTE
jgi:hypothetical protein